jgi:hypothetical protein
MSYRKPTVVLCKFRAGKSKAGDASIETSPASVWAFSESASAVIAERIWFSDDERDDAERDARV